MTPLDHSGTKMPKIAKFVSGITLLITPFAVFAQQTAAPGPERAFIANAGGDFGVGISIVGVAEGGVAERAYNEFFAGMKTWGRYELVANPARANWVFEISVGNRQSCYGYRNHRPQNDYRIELAMVDAKTLVVQKSFIEHVKQGGFFSNPDKIFDQAVAALVDDVKQEVGEPPSKTPVLGNVGPPAPVPPKIGSAQNIFTRDVSPKDVAAEKYTMGSAPLKDQLSTVLKEWGQYTVVSTPNEADLIFEISFLRETTCYGFDDPQLRLDIVDARTGVLLWAFTDHVNGAILMGNARKNFVQEIPALVSQVRTLAGTPTWPANASVAATMRAPASSQGTAAPGANGPAIPISISVARNTVKSGSSVSVNVTLKNSTKQDLAFSYPSADPLTCMVVVRDASGNAVADTKLGQTLKSQHSAWQRPLVSYTLNPGETQSRECAVSDLYDLSSPGKYSIEVTQLDGRSVHSNVLTVTVAP